MRRTVWIEESTRTKTATVRWYDPLTGEKQRELCATKSAALDFKAKKRLWLKDWKPGQVATDRDPFAILAEHLKWGVERTERPWRPPTLRSRKVGVLAFIGRPSVRSAGDFTTAEVAAYVAERKARGNKQGTVHWALKELRAFFRWCRDAKYITELPVFKVPACPNGGTRIPLDKLEAILANTPNWLIAYLVMKANTAARRFELVRADWEDMDLRRWAWNIPASKSKTGVDRTIPLGEPEKAALLSILGGRKPHDAVGPVFMLNTPKKGIRRIDVDSVERGWNQAKKRAGFKGKARLHDIRHTFASNFQGRWQSLKAICGWKTDHMASLYTHTLYAELKEDKERFGVNLGYSAIKNDNNGQ